MIGCGPHPAITIAFFLSYIMLSSFILINIFVAIIVDSVAAHYKVPGTVLAARVSLLVCSCSSRNLDYVGIFFERFGHSVVWMFTRFSRLLLLAYPRAICRPHTPD